MGAEEVSDDLTWRRWEKEQEAANKAAKERTDAWENGNQTNA